MGSVETLVILPIVPRRIGQDYFIRAGLAAGRAGSAFHLETVHPDLLGDGVGSFDISAVIKGEVFLVSRYVFTHGELFHYVI